MKTQSAGMKTFGLVGLAAISLAACAQLSPDQKTCQAKSISDDQAPAKLAACTRLIAGGAKGGALEKALAGRGQAYRMLSKFDQALQDFDRALQIDPHDAAALDQRGLTLFNEDKPDKALADFAAAIAANPDDAYAYETRGFVEHYRGDNDAAIADEGRAIELEPQAALPWANRGYAYAAKRQWDSAIADFDDAVRLASHYEYALQGRAEAERGKGDPSAAIKDFSQILGGDGQNQDALDGRAEAYADKRDWDDALSDANQAVAAFPRAAWSYSLRGDINIRRRDDAAALFDATSAVDLAPNDPEILNTRCWFRAIANAELPGALDDCERSLTIRPGSAETLDSRGFVYFRMGRYPEAITDYDAALARDAALPSSRFMRGVAKLRAGDASGGAADIAAANALDKTTAATFAGYGVTP